jgi:hypothetical protein
MGDPNFPRLVLPFQAQGVPHGKFLTFDEVTELLPRGMVRIQRCYPGAPHAIGWTVFYRQPYAFIYLNEPFFPTEGEARRYFRRTYRPEVEAFDELYTYSHI